MGVGTLSGSSTFDPRCACSVNAQLINAQHVVLLRVQCDDAFSTKWANKFQIIISNAKKLQLRLQICSNRCNTDEYVLPVCAF